MRMSFSLERSLISYDRIDIGLTVHSLFGINCVDRSGLSLLAVLGWPRSNLRLTWPASQDRWSILEPSLAELWRDVGKIEEFERVTWSASVERIYVHTKECEVSMGQGLKILDDGSMVSGGFCRTPRQRFEPTHW